VSAAPPTLLRRLLEVALPREVRDGIVGDLDEVYRTRRSTTGAFSTTLWYAMQVVAITVRFMVDRIMDTLLLRNTTVGLDLKLGARILVKYPMLTLVGGIALTVAATLGVGATEFVRDLVAPSLPLEDGERVVRVYQRDTQGGGMQPASLYDLDVWRRSIASLEDMGAYTTMETGFVSDRGEVGTVNLARISASAFRVTRVQPHLGRYITEADERPGASPVVVLGYDAWERLLGADPDPLGRTIELAGVPTTVIGVMPEGYGFPENQNAWAPLSIVASDLQPGTAPRAALFARLAPGATLGSARSELAAAGRAAAADFPAVYGTLEPGLMEFARRASGAGVLIALSAVRLLFIFLLIVICANVATLVFARTVMRAGEIAVRTSLGATRRRIVLQLFAEALVLVGLSTAIGISIASLALERISELFFIIQQEPFRPFWWDDTLSFPTIVYATVLAFVGAVVVGVVPALKATGGALQPRLGQLSSGGGGGLRFGGIWTVVIVLQVALSVAFLPLAVSNAGRILARPVLSEFPAEGYITAEIGRDQSTPLRTPEERQEYLERSAQLFTEVRDRVAAESTVHSAALASGLSAMNHIIGPVEFVGDGSAPPVSGGTRVLLVDRSYLELMNASVVAGQPLGPGDFTPESRSVLVNETFVERVLGGRNPVGGQLRFPERDPESESSVIELPEGGTTVDVLGIVRDPEIDAYGPGRHSVVYAPLDLAPVDPRAVGFVGMPGAPSTQLYIRLRSGATLSGNRLYEIVAAVDPSLRVSDVGTAADAWGPAQIGERIGAGIFLSIAGIVLMLSVAGVYALMSFSVSQRTREIAIRTAVGAGRGQIVRTVFGRSIVQLMVGVALGSLIAVPVLMDGVADQGPGALAIVVTLLLAAGVAACFVPVRRALAIEPAAAMRAD
jgi:putative ABC transport system permease protein